MSLVTSDAKTTVKLNLEVDVANLLERYTAFCKARKVQVVETALERLFKADSEWQNHLKESMQ